MGKRGTTFSPHPLKSNKAVTKKQTLTRHKAEITVEVQLEDVVTQQAVALIIFEFLREREEQLKILKDLKAKLPAVIVVVVNGSEDVQNAAEILVAGAADVFPMPYDSKLLAERVNGLLKQMTGTR